MTILNVLAWDKLKEMIDIGNRLPKARKKLSTEPVLAIVDVKNFCYLLKIMEILTILCYPVTG